MSYYDEFLRDADSHFRKLVERMLREMADVEKAIDSDRLRGEWSVEPIEEPGARGYVAKGRFQLGNPLSLPKHAMDTVREPFVDVFDDKEHVKLYIDLPGVEKDDIQLNATDAQVEIKAKNFHKNIDLPTSDIKVSEVSATYKNGVLEVIIPRTKKAASEEKKTIQID